MKFYYADTVTQRLNEYHRLGIEDMLMSYWYLANETNQLKRWELLLQFNVFLDSGAFSAWKQDFRIDIDRYIDYVRRVQHAVVVYASLDVIQEPEESMKNWEYMRQQGLDPMPVFHANESFDFLKEYVEQVGYIALGGVAGLPWAKKKIYKYFDTCFGIIGDKIKVHGFGVCNLDYLIKYPFYSADGTSWLAPAIWGKDNSYDFIRGKKGKRPKLLYSQWLKKESSRSDRMRYGYQSMAKMIAFVTETWTKRGITWND